MKIIKNEKIIKRNGTIGGWAMGIAFILMIGSLYVFYSGTTKTVTSVSYVTLAALAIGYILMLIGSNLVKRYGGMPRVDEKIDSALKGLPGDYAIYHFSLPTQHLFVGPSGFWILLPYHQRGVMAYSKNRWQIKNGGFSQSYMSIFGLDGIGRPDLEAEDKIKSVKKHLAKILNGIDIPEVRAALLLTNEQMEIQAEGAPIPAIKLKQLKEFMRQKAKEKPISTTQLAAIKSALPE